MLVPEVKFLHKIDVYTEQSRTELAHEMYFLAIINAGDDDDERATVTPEGPTGQVVEREPIDEYRRLIRRYGRDKVREVFGRFAEGKFTEAMEKESKKFWPEDVNPKTGEKKKAA